MLSLGVRVFFFLEEKMMEHEDSVHGKGACGLDPESTLSSEDPVSTLSSEDVDPAGFGPMDPGVSADPNAPTSQSAEQRD